MAKLKIDAHLSKAPDMVAAFLCSEDFLVSIDKQRDEVVDAKYSLIEKTDEVTVFEIAVTGYKHDKTGKMDKSGTNTNIAEYRWEREKQFLSVHHRGSGRILIGGSYHLQPEATGTHLFYEATIDVKIPVAGIFIAKQIMKSMEHSFNSVVSKIAE